MDYPYLDRPMPDDGDEVPVEVEIDEVAVRMECLSLTLAHLKESFDHTVIIGCAADFADFVINGNLPSKPS